LFKTQRALLTQKRADMLYLVGLGLGDEKDITVKGLEVVQKCERVYLEHYTSILTVGKEALETFYGRDVLLADRDLVEQGSDEILQSAKDTDVAFLVVGDPFGATTHSDLVLRAAADDIPFQVIHNASIMNAIGCCGLQLYNFGETVSVVFWTDSWKPESFYDKIAKNRRNGFHTLCLLDIKVKEQSVENLLRGRKIFEPPRFMSVQTAAQQFLEILDNRRRIPNEDGADAGTLEELAFDEDAICVGVARVGADDQKIVVDTLRSFANDETDAALGGPLHSLVIPAAEVHPLELDMLRMFAFDVGRFDELTKHLRENS